MERRKNEDPNNDSYRIWNTQLDTEEKWKTYFKFYQRRIVT